MSELPLISFKLYYEDLPEHLVSTFKAFKPEDQEKLRAMIKACEDKACLMLRAKQGKSIIFKLDQNYHLNTEKELIIFDLPAGKVLAPLTDELIELISKANGSTYIKAKLNGLVPSKRGVIVKTAKLQFFRADYDLRTAEELLKEHKPIDLLMLSLGYKPTKEAIAVTLPRLLTLFKYYDRNKIAGVHVVSFQQAGTGKSSTFEMLESLANAYYCEEIPTIAKLIGDARLGTYGIVKRADIIAIDEFDKIAGDFKDRFEAIFPILLTGMEQGIYRREVSSKKELSVKKAVSYCFMGNSNNKDLASYGLAEKLTAVQVLENILKASLKNANVPAFLDRLIYVEFLRESYQILRDINIDDNGLTLILQPAVARGVIKLLREQFLRWFKLGEVESRTERAVKVLSAIVKMLQIEELENDEGLIEKLVNGELTFWDCLVAKKANITESISSDKCHNTTKLKEQDKLTDVGFDVGDAFGIKRESIEDLLTEDKPKDENSSPSSNFSEQAENLATAEAKPAKNSATEDEAIEYVTVKIIDYCSPKLRTFMGVDGKVYHILEEGMSIVLPKLNAIPLVEAGVGVIVPEGMSKEELERELKGYTVDKPAEELISEVTDKPLSAEEMAKVKELRSRGYTVREIANQLNLPMVSVAKAVGVISQDFISCGNSKAKSIA
ncbi:BREX system Lon protease-like protein BrxL [Archaeoglobus profundus]|uniref:Uncharacterized protein n=1 Tax=Archaeoglobus profundus (strain DSM 5631 / JCM 9629 / NBRC 100127 / Av18) TaxID=572546 RepID=D2RDJ1_ARCPA|nr:BREX system Lon protease-like protein BrxL [Archaeoglobus profundus]ADB58185.1 hypothetical protein Arcpr_1127 [Archaeoglobus profundus DSM 5631]